jgi:hypothetical protein
MQRRLADLALAASETLHSLMSSLRTLIPGELTYRPEKHYMRGPRQK